MKKVLFYLFSMFFVGLIATSCSEDMDVPTPGGENMAEIEFHMDLEDGEMVLLNSNDLITRSGDKVDPCPDKDKLIALANAGNLCASITVDGVVYEVKVRYIPSTNSFCADALPFAVGTIVLQQFTVADCTDPDNQLPLFSAAAEGSPYSDGIDPEKLLPIKIEITEKMKFKKTPVDVYVICAVGKDPKDFGFIKWNIKFVKFICIPFVVNVCYDGIDQVGTGTISVQAFQYDDNNAVVPKSNYEVGKMKFGYMDQDGNGTYGKICYIDNPEIPNNEEYILVTLGVDGMEPIVYRATVAELDAYEQAAEWNADLCFIHLNFCECETWIFPYDCNPPQDCPRSYWEKFVSTTIDDYADWKSRVFENGAFVDGLGEVSATVEPHPYASIDDNGLKINATTPGVYEMLTPAVKMATGHVMNITSNLNEPGIGFSYQVELRDANGDEIVGNLVLTADKDDYQFKFDQFNKGVLPEACYTLLIRVRMDNAKVPPVFDNIWVSAAP